MCPISVQPMWAVKRRAGVHERAVLEQACISGLDPRTKHSVRVAAVTAKGVGHYSEPSKLVRLLARCDRKENKAHATTAQRTPPLNTSSLAVPVPAQMWRGETSAACGCDRMNGRTCGRA